ncbi:glycosyltransferase family 4 protein [Geomonas oryzisoli]|uniref:Glycosyltransferase family 4 protein n=1 Tax=Geomonas oryzisoli TaxID=2847992 RepID=A0ABX8J4I4_9BACT|nr:glycosyltransferase family 4 protein [Geomonas oryzisoli]QWV91951.1 glycosyltransferase family 4 protein [Geomonas oryzisoli]
MNIWLIKDGENQPLVPNSRKMRTWILGEVLQERGHNVTWWCSTFYHQGKELLFDHDAVSEVKAQFNQRLLHAGTYKKNFSFRRFLHHRRLAKRFSACAKKLPAPDIIVSAMPIIDLAHAAVRFSKEKSIPIVIDVRDMWPDTIVDEFPRPFKTFARLVLDGYFRMTKELLTDADGIVAVSRGCLQWGVRIAGRPQRSTDRVFYIGYQPNPVIDATRSKYAELAHDKVVFSFVGTFGKTYDFDTVISTAKRLCQERNTRIHFVFAGTGEQYDEVCRQVNELPNVTMLGWINKEDILHLMSISHVGMMPAGAGKSNYNAMPNKPFEYFSAAIPIVSSLQGEMEALIDAYSVGYSYPPGDVASFYRIVTLLSADSALRSELGANARKLYESQFRSDMIYGQYADYIENLASARG